ncbi:CHRD domain-containing protein [Nitrosomonas ureae]|uniref:CHRD domain-containing protein n=1 Tax=Nitrosomonas ureae TaxID=44577 RepID=A0A1H5WNJ8_9PROT|nr:CHRD domain-containing protein [Nitrosomonas ureae]SEG00928.1 CHRD domain-containing protein [Nitrosomonas ureae]
MKNLYIKLFLLVTLFFGLSVVYAANELKFEANLSGAQEVTSPAGGVATDTAGTIEVEFDAALTRAQFRLAVRNGTGITQAHFHCASAGVNGPIVAFLFGPADPPVDVGEGSVEVTLDNSDILPPETPEAIEACGVPLNNIASLAFAMRAGKIYANVHSTTFPAGVIRGQLLEDKDDDSDSLQ